MIPLSGVPRSITDEHINAFRPWLASGRAGKIEPEPSGLPRLLQQFAFDTETGARPCDTSNQIWPQAFQGARTEMQQPVESAAKDLGHIVKPRVEVEKMQSSLINRRQTTIRQQTGGPQARLLEYLSPKRWAVFGPQSSCLRQC